MNNERELLRKILRDTQYINYECNDKIRNEIQELLAQPEQTEQEPVATKLESHQFTAFHVSADDFKKLQKLPTGTKIYTAPPKREPLGEEEAYHEAKRLYEAEDGLWYEDGFVDGLKFAEKMHGIGGE